MGLFSQLQQCRMIDLSLTVSSDLPAAWPTHMPFVSKVWNYYEELHERQGNVRSEAPYQTRFWIIDEHCGTHFDAPTHFIPPQDSQLPWRGELGDQTGDKVPLNELAGPAAVIHVTKLAEQGDQGVSPWITAEHIQAWEKENGAVQNGEVVLFHTGWDKHYAPGAAGDRYCKLPLVHGKGPGWPAPDVSAILYLHERGIRCVGVDTPSIGAAHDGAPSHLEGLSRGMRYVEMLTGLEHLPARGAYFLFLPVKVEGSTGGPGRAIAFIEPA